MILPLYDHILFNCREHSPSMPKYSEEHYRHRATNRSIYLSTVKLSTTVVSYIIKVDLSVESEVDTRIGYISESQRNIMLQHHDRRVFQRSSFSRYITTDTQAAYRDLKSQIAVMRAASRMNQSIDRRWPRRLTVAHQARIDRHPGSEASSPD